MTILDSLEVMVRDVHRLAEKVARHDRDLAAQMKRAATSAALNGREGVWAKAGKRRSRLEDGRVVETRRGRRSAGLLPCRAVVSRLAWLLLLPCVAAGCRGGAGAARSDAGATGDRPGRTGPKPAWPTDAPSATACEKDIDCTVVVWDGPQPPDPCCDVRVGYLPMARAHLEFIAAFRKMHCAGVSCPPAPFPGAEPLCCAAIARCVHGSCVSACTLADEPLPKVSAVDPACASFRLSPRDAGPGGPVQGESSPK